MLIDTHVHCGVTKDFDMHYSKVEYMLSHYPLNHVLVSNQEAAEYDEDGIAYPEKGSQCKAFQDTISFARKYPGKISVMPWIRPSFEGVTDEFTNLIEQNLDVVRGIKFHAHNSHLASDSKALEPYYALASKWKLPVAVHTGGDECASSYHVYEAAKAHPNVNFIMVHLDLGTDNLEATMLCSKLPNLYGDTTWVSIESTLRFIEMCGSEKLLFGTDSPIDGEKTYETNGYGAVSLYQSYFHELPKLISKEDYENIMFKNAIRLFELPL